MNRPEKSELIKYYVNYAKDTNFAAHARLLQGKWRTKNNWPINESPKSNYGNFVETKFAKEHKVNFISENIKNLVTQKIEEIRSKGGLVGEPRIWNNLLSSQPLCFNLFGELYYDLDLATRLFIELFPGKISKITKIDFEFSSKRNQPDNSAFDVYIEYEHNGNKHFFGIEVKYQENLREESASKAAEIYEKHKETYHSLSNSSNYFKPNKFDNLKNPPIFQIWRDHLLAYNMSDIHIDGSFIFLYPFNNDECRKGVTEYQKFLCSSNEELTHFYPLDLNHFILTLNKICNTKWSNDLIDRYIGIKD